MRAIFIGLPAFLLGALSLYVFQSLSSEKEGEGPSSQELRIESIDRQADETHEPISVVVDESVDMSAQRVARPVPADVPSEDAVQAAVLDLGEDWVEELSDDMVGTGDRLHGLRHGPWQIHYKSSSATEYGRFIFGARHGKWILRSAEGDLMRECFFVAGKREGDARWREDDNSEWTYIKYRNGKEVHGDLGDELEFDLGSPFLPPDDQ